MREFSRNIQPQFLFSQSIYYGFTQYLIIHKHRVLYASVDEANIAFGSFFLIGGKSVFVPLSQIIIPGHFGSQCSIFIRCRETGQNLIVRFVGFKNEVFCEETQQSTLFFEVILRGSSELRVVPLKDIYPFFPTPDEIAELDARVLPKRLKDAHDSLLTFPLNTDSWDRTNHLAYPFLPLADIFVLWTLCRIHNVEMEFNYQFNKLLIRFLACGPQDKYFENGIEGVLSMLTVRDQIDFSEFMRIYADHLMGTKMVSKSQRRSAKSALEIFLMEFSYAKACNASSTFALELPTNYFMRREPDVLVVQVDTHVPHTLLLLLENPE
jgi:hypothetical protein